MILPNPPEILSYSNALIRLDGCIAADEAKGWVPYYHFQIFNKDASEKAGHINFRVGDNEHIRIVAGHIGYGINPEFRGHALSYDACRAIEPFVRTIYKTVLITADPDNIASLKIIEKLGAEFIDQVAIPQHEPQYGQGSGYKNRYNWHP